MRRRFVRIALTIALLAAPIAQYARSQSGWRTTNARASALLTLTPSTGVAGTFLQVSTSDQPFDPGATITLSFSDNSQHYFLLNITHPSTADSNGNLSNVQIQIPTASVLGDGTVTALESSGSGQTASGIFTVTTGTNTSPTPSPTQIAALPSATSIIPSATPTSVPSPTLTSTAVTGNTPLQISPISGSPGLAGVSVTVLPAGFPAYATVSLSFMDANVPASVNPNLGTAVAAADGSVHALVTIPSGATAGSARIAATSGTTVAGGAFTVVPRMTISPATWTAGATAQVDGVGFVPNRLLVLSANQQTITTVATNANGAFSTSMTVPATLPSGPGMLTATDQTDSAVQAHAPYTFAQSSVTPTATRSATATTATRTATATKTATETKTATATRTPTATPFSTAFVPAAATATAGTTGAATTAYFAEGYTGQAATNGKATFDEVLNLLNPSSDAVPVSITYYLQDSSTPQTLSRTIPASSLLRESVNDDVGPDQVVGALVSSPGPLVASRTISRVTGGNGRLDGSSSLAATAPATRWDFPEGYTGISFQEYLTVLNPSTVPATVRILLAPQAGSAAGARTYTLSVPAQSRATANIRGLNSGNATRSVGLIVTSDVPVVAERVEYFGAGAGSGKFGSSVSRGITTPAAEVRFGYARSGGTTITNGSAQPAGDQAYITLIDPAFSGLPVRVTARFTGATGQPIGQQVVVSVAPGARQTIGVNAALGVAPAGPVSIVLSATAPIEAELAQYYGGSPNVGSHAGVALPGATGAMSDAFLSDLSTQQIDGATVRRVLYVYNPYNTPIRVAATYIDSGGNTVPSAYAVPAGGVTTIEVSRDSQAILPAGPLGIELKVEGTGGFLATAIGRTVDNLSYIEDIGSPL